MRCKTNMVLNVPRNLRLIRDGVKGGGERERERERERETETETETETEREYIPVTTLSPPE